MPIAAKNPLTEHGLKVLQTLACWRGPIPPSRKALAQHMGGPRDLSAIRYYLSALERDGYIAPIELGHAKLDRVTPKGMQALEQALHLTQIAVLGTPPRPLSEAPALAQPIPIAGPLHAGGAGVQYDEPRQFVRGLKDLLPIRDGEALYATWVRGDCMAGLPQPLHDGDALLLRPCSRIDRPRNGSLVHVELPLAATGGHENEPLIREYWFDEGAGMVTLRCYNPGPGEAAEASYPDEAVDPRGVVVAMVHNTPDARRSEGRSSQGRRGAAGNGRVK